jgi:hypothetical protein
MKMLLDFSADICVRHYWMTIWNGRLLKIINDNGVKVVNFTTYQNLPVKSEIFSHMAFINSLYHVLIERLNSQIHHIMKDRRRPSSVFHVRLFRPPDYDIIFVVVNLEYFICNFIWWLWCMLSPMFLYKYVCILICSTSCGLLAKLNLWNLK